MFRRTSKAEPTTPPPPKKGPGAKGRPTPSRKEAEAAARERARQGMDKKAAEKVLRERRVENNAKVRQAMRTGDDRYLPARDRGPVKRFVRDFVDSRVSIAEFLLPLLLVILAMQYSGDKQVKSFGTSLWTVALLVIIVDTAWVIFRMRRAMRSKFPEESPRGTTFYAVMRLVQLRWLRMPKPQVKVGGAPKPRA